MGRFQYRHRPQAINSHGQTSAVMLSNYFGSVTNVIVDNNRLVEEWQYRTIDTSLRRLLRSCAKLIRSLLTHIQMGGAPAQRAASCCLVGPNAKFGFDEKWRHTETTTECAKSKASLRSS